MSAPFADLAVEFVGSFPDPRTALDPALPEIAVIGRSNVGKSSLLNALTGRKGLARVSATPGKSRAHTTSKILTTCAGAPTTRTLGIRRKTDIGKDKFVVI